MPSAPRRYVLLVISGLLAVTPVAFGVIRAVNTGRDLRYLWLAGASLLGSWIVALPVGRGASGPSHISLPRTVGAVAAGAVFAAVAAILQGAIPGPGLAIVAIAFGLCTGASAIFLRYDIRRG